MRVMAVTGFEVGIELAKRRELPYLVMSKTNYVDNKEHWVNGGIMAHLGGFAPHLKEEALKYGCHFTHRFKCSTGTISLSLNNNASNGIEPTFSHKYTRNVIVEGKKSKQAVDVYSYEMLLYKAITGKDTVPEVL